MKYPYSYMEPIARQVKDILAPLCSRIEIAGSIRRKCAYIKDIELVYVLPAAARIEDQPEIRIWQTICDRWEVTKGKPHGKYIQARLAEGIKLDLFRATPENWGLQLAIRTGSADYSHKILATGWALRGYHSDGGILYPVKQGMGTGEEAELDRTMPVYLREEEDVFAFIGKAWVPPENRQ